MNKGNFLVYVAVLLSLLFGIVIPSCLAADSQLDNEIAAYNKGDYQQAVEIGHAIISKNPGNATARYYLANSYCQLKQFEHAIQEYSSCMKLAKDSPIALYSSQALSVLKNSADGRASSEAMALDTNKIESQVADLKDKYAQEEQDELDKCSKDAQTMIDHITARQDEDVAAVPRYIYNAAGYSADNADYDLVVTDIRQRAQTRIKDISDRLPKQQEMIKQNYQEKINGLGSSIMNISSKIASDKEGYQLNSAGTDLYVRNYSQTNLPRPPVVKALPVAPESVTQ